MIRKILGVVAIAALFEAGSAPLTGAGAVASAPIRNPGFEADGASVAQPKGWKTDGDEEASLVEGGGHSGGFRLTHSGARAYSVETRQKLTGLVGGWHTLRVWVRRSPGDVDAWIGFEDCGQDRARTILPVSTTGWLQIVVSANVRRQSCTVVLHTSAAGGEWAQFDDVDLVPGRARLSVLGGDVSSLTKSEAFGGVYRDQGGAPRDALAILSRHGLNWIRIRAWVHPADGYHDTTELLSMARRARALGLKVLVNLHYSDFWADPGKQWTPAAWQGQTFAGLKQSFITYTRDVMQALVDQGTPPDMIQLGNEINPGMLWDYAATWTGDSTADDGMGIPLTVHHTENWPNLAELLTVGYETVKAVSPRTRVMLHLAEGGSNGTFRWWFDNVTSRNVPFDVIGASYYGYWHGSLADLQYNLNDVTSHYDKDVVVAETAYPFTLADDDNFGNIIDDAGQLVPGYPATPAGQAANFRDVMSVVRAVPNGRGLGVFYWEPTWTGVAGNGWSPRDPTSGNGWENQALFDFNDRPLPAMREFRP
jgi:arabinogalactan endo-1,4-beta-galactosidase